MMGRETDSAEESTAATRLVDSRPRKERIKVVFWDGVDEESGILTVVEAFEEDGPSVAVAVVVVVVVADVFIVECFSPSGFTIESVVKERIVPKRAKTSSKKKER
jgi:hypothetical protein